MKNKKATNSNLNMHNHVGVSRYATQNNQSHVGAGPVSAQNAITLVALVITVIILLILAGVTINLTLGNNGIFNTAQKAAKNYTDAQNKEQANLNEFENTVEKVTQAPEYNPCLLKLKPGDYVKYDTGVKEVGENGIATFRVLYDATSEYGLQIISDKNLENVRLGGSDWETGKESYNNTIVTLNNEAMKYKNDTYAIDARCVGSNPTNKNSEMTNAILPFTPNGWTTTDSGCIDTDENYVIDLTAMKKTQICTTEQTYWLASRFVYASSDYYAFRVRVVFENGEDYHNYLCDVYPFGLTNGYIYTHGLRPCITLKPDITITSGDGASEATAYTLGI